MVSRHYYLYILYAVGCDSIRNENNGYDNDYDFPIIEEVLDAALH